MNKKHQSKKLLFIYKRKKSKKIKTNKNDCILQIHLLQLLIFLNILIFIFSDICFVAFFYFISLLRYFFY